MAEETPAPEEAAPTLTREQQAQKAYKDWKATAAPKYEALKKRESREAAAHPKEDQAQLKAMNEAQAGAMQRNRIRNHARKRSYVQDRHLNNYNHLNKTDYDYETFFEALDSGDVKADDDLAQKITFFEVQKKYGVVPPEKASVPTYRKMRESEKKLDELFKLSPREGQQRETYGGVYRDLSGKDHVFTRERLVEEDSGQRRLRKGRAAMNAGTAEGVLGGIDLDDEMRAAFTSKRSGNVSIPLYKTVDGDVGFDVYTAVVELQGHYMDEALINAGKKGRELTPKATELIRARARQRAEKKVGAIMSRGTGVYFVDSDPQRKTEEIANTPAWKGGRLLAPVWATLAGAETHDSAWNQNHKQLEGQGRLEYLANIALSTAAGAAIHAGGWGTPEHIKIIREGYDITDDFGNIAKFATPRFMEKEQSGSAIPETILGVSAMIPLLLLDPDLTLLLGPVGKAGKLIGKGSKLTGPLLGPAVDAARLMRTRALFKPVLEAKEGEITADFMQKFLKDLKVQDHDAWQLVDRMYRAEEGMEGIANIPAGVEKARKALSKADDEVAKARKNTRILQSAEKKSQAEYALRKAEFRATGARVEVLQEQLATAEAKLMDLLPRFDAQKYDMFAKGSESATDKQSQLKFLRKEIARMGGPKQYQETLLRHQRAPKKAIEAHHKMVSKLSETYGDDGVKAIAQIRTFLADIPQEDLLRLVTQATEKAKGLKGVASSKAKFPERGLDFKWNEKAHGIWASRSRQGGGKDVAYLRLKSEPRIKDLIPISQRPSELASLYKKHGDAPVEKVWMVGVDYSLRKKGLGTELYERAIQAMQKKHPKGFYLIPSSFGKAGEGSTVHAAEEIWKKLAKKYPSAGNAIYIGPQKASKKISSGRAFIEALPPKFIEIFERQGVLSPAAFTRYLKSKGAVIKGRNKYLKAHEQLTPLLIQAQKAKDLNVRLSKEATKLRRAAQSDLRAGSKMIDDQVEVALDAARVAKIDAARAAALARGAPVLRKVVQELSESIKVVADNLASGSKANPKINPLKGALKGGRATGERVLDVKTFRKNLDERYGAETVEALIEEAAQGSDNVERIFARLAGHGVRGPVRITLDEQVALRRGIDGLDARAADFVGESEVAGRNLLHAVTSVHQGARYGPGGFGETLPFRLRQALRKFALTHSENFRRFGAPGKGISKVYKKALEIAQATSQEFTILTKGLRDAELKKVALAYLEGTASMLLKGGNFKNTMMNTGPMSLVEQAFRHIISNKVVRDAVESAAVKGSKEDLAWLDKAAKAIKAGEGVEEWELPKALKAIARAWLPSGVQVTARQAAQLERGTAEIISEMVTDKTIDFSRLMDRIAEMTDSIIGSVDKGDKAWNFAMQGILDGAVMDKAAVFASQTWKPMSRELADDLNALMKGEMDNVDDIKGAFRKLAEYGSPLGHRFVADTEAMGEKMADLVQLSKVDGGEAVFVPTTLYADINKLSGKIVKDLEAVAMKAPKTLGGSAINTWIRFMQLFRTSVTTGLLLPNPRYWVNNIMGDFSQIWLEHGLGTATRLSFQNLPANLPFGRELHNMILKAGEDIEGVPFLGSMYNSMINPQLNKVFTAPPGTIIKLGDGSAVKVDDLRKMMVEDGMLDTFVAETLLRGLRKEVEEFRSILPDVLGKTPEFARSAQEALAKHATFVQQRQRAALYLDLLSKGASREQAKKGVLSALYDWKAPLYAIEKNFLARMFTFWRFYRLASQQFLKAALGAFTGENKLLRRARQMQKITETGTAAAYHASGSGEESTAVTPGEKYDAMLRDVPFWWQQARPTAFAQPLTDPEIKEWLKDHGYDFTYQKVLLPPFTPLDMANMWLGFGQVLLMAPAMAVGAEIPEGKVAELLIDPLGALLIPGMSGAFEKGAKDYFVGTQFVGAFI